LKHLIVGDVHGYHHNLRKFLVEQGVVNKRGEAINRDEFKVYCTGDLIDGNYNRQGDLLNLEYAKEWFDAVLLGNHEYAFIGGNEFGGRRRYDRTTLMKLLQLVSDGLYVPAALVHGHLLVHGGFSDLFNFTSADDAYAYILAMWAAADELDEEIPIFKWQGSARSYNYGDPTGGIFELDWTEDRNPHFPQVVGHSTYYTGPIMKEYENGIRHWNIDVGGKTGDCVGGIILDDATSEIEIAFWGKRHENAYKVNKTYPPTGETMTHDPDPKKNRTIFRNGEIVQLSLATERDVNINVLDDPDVIDTYLKEVQKDSTVRFGHIAKGILH
jgi:hypothetical protein